MSVLPARETIFWGLPGSRLCWAAQLGSARGGSRVTGPGQLVKFCATIRPAGSLVDQSCFPSRCFTYTGAHFFEAVSVSRAREHCSCKPPGPSFPRSAELMSVLRAWETTFFLPPGWHLGWGAQLGSARGSGPRFSFVSGRAAGRAAASGRAKGVKGRFKHTCVQVCSEKQIFAMWDLPPD